MSDKQYDAIIIGAGHNGLVTAAYLARDGLSVLVLERLDRVGGACTTEEVFPGVNGPFCAYVCHALQGKVIDDLKLREHGFEILKHPDDIGMGSRFTPYPDGTFLGGPGVESPLDIATQINGFSEHDARASLEWNTFWEQAAGILHPYLLTEPPSLSDLVHQVRGTSQEDVLEKMITWSVIDLAEDYFEEDRVRALFLGQPETDPRKPGSVMSVAILRAISHFTRDEDTGVPRGSMGAITEAMARSARSYGAEIRTGTPVENVLVEGGSARGVRLSNGEEIRASIVVSNADPKRTFNTLFQSDEISKTTLGKVNRLKTQAGCVKFLAAISELPDYSRYLGAGYDRTSVVYTSIRPSVDYIVQSWQDAADGVPSTCPVMMFQITTLREPSLTPKGQHFLSNWSLYYPPTPKDGTWDDHRDKVGERIIDAIAEHAPNFRDSLIDWTVQTPADLEARVGLTDGNIRHLDHIPQQLLTQRQPYRTEVGNFYMCGSGTHPSGEVTGAPGHNAAHAILKDLERVPA